MDFFSRQDQARRKTWALIVYFIIAMLVVTAFINLTAYIVFKIWIFYLEFPNFGRYVSSGSWLDSHIWLYVSLATISIILIATLHRLWKLGDGGIAVALLIGAKPLLHGSHQHAGQNLINVVEEMAIAAGMPVPQLFILDNEKSINAFVAGFHPTESVMVVTRGALDQLNRDELQGVVGHEFSHILNGDMRINLRLLALLAGISLIGRVGGYMMQNSGEPVKQGHGGGGFIMLITGLLLYVAGYSGLFCGRVIKAAISRQREFLADASSVQFTRNPKGLASALYKIKSSPFGARLHNAYAEDFNHMCIGEVMAMNGWLATHPPLDDRIEAIDPAFLSTQRAKKIISQRKSESVSPVIDTSNVGHALSATVGNVSAQQLAIAGEIHAAIPSVLIQNLHAVEGAASIIYALLEVQGLPDKAQAQVNLLRSVTDKLDRRMRLPLIDMALPQLKRMHQAQRNDFVATLEKAVKADKRYTLNEFVILAIIKQHLSVGANRADVVKYHSFKPLMNNVLLLLSVLVQCSGQSHDKKQRAWERAVKVFSADVPVMHDTPAQVTQISEALEKIRQSPMLLRKSFIDVCADLVKDDGIIMPAEAELLRAICESIDCPMPPLLAA